MMPPPDMVGGGFPRVVQADGSDRLLIPEKLYCRETEVKHLLAAFKCVAANGHLELMLISGYFGISKSEPVNEQQKPITESFGIFGTGKFDQ